MMKTIDIKDASIAEEIRKQMSTATTSDKGLMNKTIGINPFRLYIELDKETERELPFNYGLISLISIQKGYSSILLLGTIQLEIVHDIPGPFRLSTVKDTPGKVNLYKTGEDKLIIQNKTSDQFRFYISLL